MARTLEYQTKAEYIQDGLSVSPDKTEISVDLAQPRTVLVRARNEQTGEARDYILRVTASGKLVLH